MACGHDDNTINIVLVLLLLFNVIKTTTNNFTKDVAGAGGMVSSVGWGRGGAEFEVTPLNTISGGGDHFPGNPG